MSLLRWPKSGLPGRSILECLKLWRLFFHWTKVLIPYFMHRTSWTRSKLIRQICGRWMHHRKERWIKGSTLDNLTYDGIVPSHQFLCSQPCRHISSYRCPWARMSPCRHRKWCSIGRSYSLHTHTHAWTHTHTHTHTHAWTHTHTHTHTQESTHIQKFSAYLIPLY